MRIHRRRLTQSGIAGMFAFAAARQLDAMFAAPVRATRRCIMLWMDGGPSQLDTFDPKPGTKTGGEFRAIPTASSEITISEALPLMARHMDKLSIVRNLSSNEGDHERGNYYMHTGFVPVPSFPRPTVGSIVSRHTPTAEIPKYVSLGGRGFGPAYMGPDHAPFVIEDANQAKDLLGELRRRRSRLGLVRSLDTAFAESQADAMLERREAMMRRVENIVTTPFVDALNLEHEPEQSRARYGDSSFGQQCLLARRLIESGVHFVEVQLGGWDTHADNFSAVRNLCSELDRPWACLMDDLSASGLLEETIVLWMGEFGRTPIINGSNGRDHFPDVSPVVIGGGGIPGGRVIGMTNRDGTAIDGEAYKVPDLFATILHRFGIAPDHEIITSFDSPTKATEEGRVIKELS